MASGIPVVSTSLGMEGLPAENGNNCLIADTPELMIDCIRWMMDDRELSNEIAHHARDMISSRFSIEKSMSYLEKTLQDVVNA
jgi:glycosyltransferase involved in cell wall biosynthesis